MCHQNSQSLWLCHWNHCVFSLLIFCLPLFLLPVCARPKIIWHVYTVLSVTPALLVLVVFLLFSGVLYAPLVCELNFLSVYCWSSTLHIIFSNPNSSISNIPNRTGQSYGSAMNLHLTSLYLCLNQTEKKFPVVLCLNVFRNNELLFVVSYYSMVDFGREIWILWMASNCHLPWSHNFIHYFSLPLAHPNF